MYTKRFVEHGAIEWTGIGMDGKGGEMTAEWTIMLDKMT